MKRSNSFTRASRTSRMLALLLALTTAPIAQAAGAAKAGQHAANRVDVKAIQAMNPSFLYLAAEDALLRDQPALAMRFLEILVQKDPKAMLPRIELAELLARNGQTDRARQLIAGLDEAALPAELRDRADMLQVQVYLAERKRDDAIGKLRIILKRRPDDADARTMLIRLLQQESRWHEAHQAVREGIKQGDRARWMRLDAELYIQQKKDAKARRILNKLRRMRPDDAGPVLMLARMQIRAGKPAAAERLLRDFLASHPHHLSVSNALGRLLVGQGRAREAIPVYEDIAQSTGGNPEVLIALGLLYYQQKDYAHAADRFRQALKHRDSDRARYYLAASLDAQGKAAEAKSLYANINRRSPTFVRAQMRLAAMDIEAKRMDAAESRLRDLLRDHPGLVDARALLASILVQQKRFKEALKETETALALPGAPADRLLYDRAAAFEGLKRYDEAAAAIRQLLKQHPDDPEALNFLGYLYAEQGAHLKEAERLIRKALKLKPDNGYYLDSLAWTYYKEGRYRKAERIQRKAVAKVGDDPVMQEHLGDILWRTGKHDEAKAAWRKALKLGHEHPDALRKKLETGL